MQVGDLVQISVESIMSGKSQDTVEGFGIIVRDLSPMRPSNLPRLVEVLWDDGVDHQHTNDLVVIDG